ncbi:MAG: bifunctional DNA primase/polymerase, partial [Alphaproteobacteria bacterium]|nr:bifunctional DNA primase/polymerase [Alphaproteobacteria bacterium]
MTIIPSDKRKFNSSTSQTGAKNPTKKFLYAQALAKKGFRIFPLEVNGKKPLHEGWQQEAAADASPWARGEDYNIGVATGQGIVVIDVDMKNGVDGEANWKWFCEKMNIPESPVQVATASPVPGRHIKYTVPLDAKIPNSVGKIAAGVDVRGEGGYVVGIGSVIDGREYTKIGIWGKGGGQRLAMPQALIDACGRGRERVADDLRDIPEGGELDTEANIASGRAYLKVAPESVQGAGGDATAF